MLQTLTKPQERIARSLGKRGIEGVCINGRWMFQSADGELVSYAVLRRLKDKGWVGMSFYTGGRASAFLTNEAYKYVHVMFGY